MMLKSALQILIVLISWITQSAFSLKENVLGSRRMMKVIRQQKSQVSVVEGAELQLYNPLFPSSDSLIPLVETPSDYVYTAPEVGLEIYVGSAIALVPIIWGTIEFISRIKVQRACLLCNGAGLVYRTRSGSPLTRPRKCWSCGGFIPWLGWKMFFLSTAYDVGNGGPLQRPSSDYEQINEKIRSGDILTAACEKQSCGDENDDTNSSNN